MAITSTENVSLAVEWFVSNGFRGTAAGEGYLQSVARRSWRSPSDTET
jgi:hypothetical protein